MTSTFPDISLSTERLVLRPYDEADIPELVEMMNDELVTAWTGVPWPYTETTARAFVTGFGLQRGAIAASVGHDSHNICVVGVDDQDMAGAVNRLREIGGGYVVASGGEVLAELPLPVAGLISLQSFEAVRAALIPLRRAARDLGCTLPEPFLQVSFLPLPVIPHLKITDFGLFDVDRFALVDQ